MPEGVAVHDVRSRCVAVVCAWVTVTIMMSGLGDLVPSATDALCRVTHALCGWGFGLWTGI